MIRSFSYGSVCSGIEAATVAWEPLGWRAAWFAEIEDFPSAVLKHHYPAVPNLGDMTKIAAQIRLGYVEAPDALVGGTPCQAFSVAGVRAGLDDPRGQLTLSYVDLLDAIDEQRPANDRCIAYWENVPGVLSDKKNAFGCFLGLLAGEDCALVSPGGSWPNAGCVYGPQRTIAWRVLDAQYFGVAQRRRRVFVVASARKDFNPAALLFESDGVRRDIAPSREPREEITGTLSSRATGGGGLGTDLDLAGGLQPAAGIAGTLQGNGRAAGSATQQDAEAGMLVTVAAFGGNNTSGPIDVATARNACASGSGRLDFETETFITHTLRGDGFDASEDGTGRGTPLIPVPHVDVLPTLRSGNPNAGSGHGARSGDTKDEYLTAVAFQTQDRYGDPTLYVAHAQNAFVGWQVRRLTPRECERLQGFPDNYTLIPTFRKNWRGDEIEEFREYFAAQGWELLDNEIDYLAADGPRYKALGNSMAVPCMHWLGVRLMVTHPHLFLLKAA